MISSMVILLPPSAFISPSKEWAAEDGCCALLRFIHGEQRDDSRPARIIARVPARARNATAEDQLSLFVVKHSLAGGRRVKTTGLDTFIVLDHTHAGNGCSARPKVSFLPILREVCWLDEEHIRRQTPLSLRHNSSQLAYTCSRAGAVWVCQHDERRAITSAP